MQNQSTVVVQLLHHVQLFVTPRTAGLQTSLSFSICWSLLKLMPMESVMKTSLHITKREKKHATKLATMTYLL